MIKFHSYSENHLPRFSSVNLTNLHTLFLQITQSYPKRHELLSGKSIFWVNLQTRHKVVTFQSSSRMERVLPMKVATSGGTLSYRLCYPVKAKSRVLLFLLAFLSRHKFINLTDLIQTQREEKTRVRHARVISPTINIISSSTS